MPRPLRVQFPGAIYHVTGRGNNKKEIFQNVDDADRFLEIVSEAVAKYGIIVHAYCLMINHYHFLIETPNGNLSLAMKHINQLYTQWLNKRYEKVGHVFQGRFKSKLIESDSQLLEVCRYIVNNPVRAGIADKPKDYSWSSYKQTAGLVMPNQWLTVSWIHSQFADSYEKSVERYVAFVDDCV
jgi:putative transposase